MEEDPEEKEIESPRPSLAMMVPIPIYHAEYNMLRDACSKAGVNPRRIRRLVHVFKLLKLIWHQQKLTQEAPGPDLKRACVIVLAMCASKSNTLLRGMRAIFDKIENSMDKPQQPNLRAFIDKVAGAAVLTSISVDKALVAVALDTDMEWNTIKAH